MTIKFENMDEITPNLKKIEQEFEKRSSNLLKNNKKTYAKLHDDPIWTELQPILIEASNHIELHHDSEDIKEAFAEEYVSFNRGIVAEVVKQKQQEEKTLTQKIDDILIHPMLGLPIFLFFCLFLRVFLVCLVFKKHPKKFY